ncbi:MAG: hypothetical protein ABIQ11_07325 [Saprospiraceae bacterium]
MREIFISKYKYIFLTGLAVLLTTAYFSEGYFHQDEQFQILEFTNYKLGKSPATDLAWEHAAKIRPALQPALAYGAIKVLSAIGITSPFHHILLFRLITAFLMWLVTSKLCVFLVDQFSTEKGKKLFVMMSMFLWFVPFLSVRFSSEVYSTLTFLVAVYLILRYKDSGIFRYLIAGFMMGFSFFFRFQVAFAIMGIGLWMIMINKSRWQHIAALITGVIISALLCIYLDRWFYGGWELTPLNYFNVNILEGKAAQFGVSPWWYYFSIFIIKALPPISVFLLFFFIIGVYKKPRDPITWFTLAFLVAHLIVGHKELRFIFPMIFPLIYFAAIGVDYFLQSGKYQKVIRFVITFSVVVNFLLLFVRTFLPVDQAINYYRFLYNNFDGDEILFCRDRDLYNMSELNVNFYRSEHVNCNIFTQDSQITLYLETNKPDSIFIFERKISDQVEHPGYNKERIYCFFPKWLLAIELFNWKESTSIWNVQKLTRVRD